MSLFGKRIATKTFFRVTIDALDLGVFTSCEGLGVNMDVMSWEEGGNNVMVWQLPTRLKHSNIRVSRPVTPESPKITKWMEQLPKGITRPTASISALNQQGMVIVKWGLRDVLPISWQGPSFDPNAPGIANESLELAHHGFIDVGGV